MQGRVRASRNGAAGACASNSRKRGRQGCLSAGLATAAVLALTPPAIAVTYYVRVSGDDTQDGLAPTTALASIRSAGRRLMAPGDRVIVGPGIYPEGNIEPHGSGTPDDPIVFSADSSGLATHDPPGPVTIVPPNTPDATTGFIVFGKHDIVIEGFTIEGAVDPGIQVRPHFSTGVDSTRITARDNLILRGRMQGIEMIAVGDVTAIGNTVTDNWGAGLSFMNGDSAALRPFVSSNGIERNGVGIAVWGTSGGTITENELHSNNEGVGIVGGDTLLVRGNEIDSVHRALVSNGSIDLQIVGNKLRRGVKLFDIVGLVFEKNEFLEGDVGMEAAFYRGGEASISNNRLPRMYITGGVRLELRNNSGRSLEARSLDEIVAVGNQFEQPMQVFAISRLELVENVAPTLAGSGRETIAVDNHFAGRVEIFAETVTLTGNRAGSLVSRRTRRGRDDEPSGTFLVEGNVSGGVLRIGESAAPMLGGVVSDNTADRMLRVFARDELDLRRNQAAGIACALTASDSRVVVAENTSRGGIDAGIIVAGAGTALVENNVSSENGGSGLVVRRTSNLTVAGNVIESNAIGGVSLEGFEPPIGDCNHDCRIGIEELVTIVGIVLDQIPLRECAAADSNGDDAAMLDELVRSVAAALRGTEPCSPSVTEGILAIHSNRIERNTEFGVKLFTDGLVSAVDNQVLGNGGIAIAVRSRRASARVEIAENWLGSAAGEGLFLKGTPQARIRSNAIFSNGEAGILLRDAPGVTVVNNLIYDNGDDGIAVGRGTALPAPGVVLMNNTLYANRGFAVTIGSAGAPSTGTMLLNNIVDGNAKGGFASDLASLPGLTIGFNLNNDGYSQGVEPSVTDFTADPRFVLPEGVDGLLGGSGFADDDFHLRGDEPASAAIDAGSATAVELGITGSAVAGGAADEGVVDLAFHYVADSPSPPSRRLPLRGG
jgi:parallel beta-helix repeat protein